MRVIYNSFFTIESVNRPDGEATSDITNYVFNAGIIFIAIRPGAD